MNITAKKNELARLSKILSNIRTKLSPWIIEDDGDEEDEDVVINLGLSNGLKFRLTIEFDGNNVDQYLLAIDWHDNSNGVYTMPEWCLLGMTKLNTWNRLFGYSMVDTVFDLHDDCEFDGTFNLVDLVKLLNRLEKLDTTHVDQSTCINVIEYQRDFINDDDDDDDDDDDEDDADKDEDDLLSEMFMAPGATAADIYNIILRDPLKYTDPDDIALMARPFSAGYDDWIVEFWPNSLSTLAKFIVNGDVVG